MPLHHKLPLPVDAVQLSWRTWDDVRAFLDEAFLAENPQGGTPITATECSDTCDEQGPQYISLNVRTTHGDIAVVRHGDWIVREDTPGRFYPVKPDVFARTYGPSPQEAACTTVTVDDEDIRVHGRGDLTDNGREALGALLEVARRKMVVESVGGHDTGNRMQSFNLSVHHFNAPDAEETYDRYIHCPLCSEPTVLGSPREANRHFFDEHPDARRTGPGPWPMLEIAPQCSHCGQDHDWQECETYAEAVRAERNAGLVARLDNAVRDVLSGAFGTFLDCEDAQVNALHHMLVSAMAAEVHRKMPTG